MTLGKNLELLVFNPNQHHKIKGVSMETAMETSTSWDKNGKLKCCSDYVSCMSNVLHSLHCLNRNSYRWYKKELLLLKRKRTVSLTFVKKLFFSFFLFFFFFLPGGVIARTEL